MPLYNALIKERDIAIQNGDFETYNKLCSFLDILTIEECSDTVEL